MYWETGEGLYMSYAYTYSKSNRVLGQNYPFRNFPTFHPYPHRDFSLK